MMGIAMADVRSELPPVSDVVTDFIRVQVVSQHSAENSRPDQGVWVF
jgi:hypothetical protein